ncbi:SDR family oxidoreductase [Fulvivirgaceae bacterium BMA10]|uniref:SDR family oxidoreductase n=1 Tax=Splendidivirga corallicola TaxID=3051826 RepID=A0ABT8KMW0_9BACT|nr:SDR family oxidoreductase [Fulvivirgaceae bacterium BMA10]
MKIDLTNKKVLITGASRGIGKAITEQMAEAGATVAIHYFKNDTVANDLAKKLSNGCQPFGADLANPSEVTKLFDNVIESFGDLDILINNAGIALQSPIGTKDDQWLDDWQTTLRVNLDACALLCKKALELFSMKQKGKIINISSRAAFRGDTADYMAYAASKGGMVALTRSIARAYGKFGITAFNIAPGFTRTDMAQSFIDQYGEDFALRGVALDRLTEPKDIAPMVVFLASGLADHATGCTIDINAASYVH